MSSHSNRSTYFVCGESILNDPDRPSSGCPVTGKPGTNSHRRTEPQFKFGRMFPQIKPAVGNEKFRHAVVAELMELATTINSKQDDAANDSDLPAGYTYLGQFIAHEVTFDKTEEPLESNGDEPDFRSPSIDLDSLYGQGPKDRRLYQDGARLKVGETIAGPEIRKTFFNDLPRVGFGNDQIGKALIPDPRNDENLAVAQTHLAFIKFHNKVVDAVHLRGTPPDKLFETAKREVVQHFQWIILKDFLPKLLHKQASEILETGEPKLFKPDPEYGLFMPLEFSVAAFRFGHSMVRDKYEWNFIQNSDNDRPATINNLFRFTSFSGDLHLKPRLESDWVIDWRRFYDLTEVGYPDDQRLSNKARKIDTFFSLRLEQIKEFPLVTKDLSQQSIVARNLLRGFACGLPCGEDVAKLIGIKKSERLTETQIGIETRLLTKHTPLWYYILKEAEFNKGKLGPVASIIIAETLVGLIKQSPYSILNDKSWKPKYGPRADEGKFEMADLLVFAEVVDPIGEHMGAPL
jgi:Animal haem peroxidase